MLTNPQWKHPRQQEPAHTLEGSSTKPAAAASAWKTLRAAATAWASPARTASSKYEKQSSTGHWELFEGLAAKLWKTTTGQAGPLAGCPGLRGWCACQIVELKRRRSTSPPAGKARKGILSFGQEGVPVDTVEGIAEIYFEEHLATGLTVSFSPLSDCVDGCFPAFFSLVRPITL